MKKFLVLVCLIIFVSIQAQAYSEVIPHLNVGLEKDKSLIYSSSFQLAWNELQDNIIGENIKLIKSQDLANELNKQRFTKDMLNPDSYLVFSGEVNPANIDRFNKKITDKFNGEMPLLVDNPNPPFRTIVSYSYLYKNLKFARKFEVINEFVFRDSNNVETTIKGFGIGEYDKVKHNELTKQVEIYDYKNDDNFIVKLLEEPSDNLFNNFFLNMLNVKKTNIDEIILAKVEPKETLDKTVNYVKERLKKRKEKIEEGDTLQIPKINLEQEKSFDKLVDVFFLNQGWRDWYIKEAKQNIRFNLDEKGAEVKSVAKVKIQEYSHHVQETRSLIFDRPFLLMLKQKNADEPYLVMWINNAEFFIQTKNEEITTNETNEHTNIKLGNNTKVLSSEVLNEVETEVKDDQIIFKLNE